MDKFCSNCGRELVFGRACECQKSNIFTSAKSLIRDGVSVNSDNDYLLERNKKIVPDSIRPDDSEQPIKQYRLARLRSRFRGQYAEGRLQVTNKRLLFRAAGISSLGKTVVQQEFAINEISGIEVKKSNRVSLLNAFLCAFLSLFLSSKMEAAFASLAMESDSLANFVSYVFSVVCLTLLFFCKDRYWIKFLALSVTVGTLIGASAADLNPLSIVLNFELFSVTNILIFILSLAWAYSVLRVCFVPDLVFSVKTKSSNDIVQIRRKVWGAFTKQPQEYTGFSEVLPWSDTDKATEELGALINDLQTMGDMAIDTWKDTGDHK